MERYYDKDYVKRLVRALLDLQDTARLGDPAYVDAYIDGYTASNPAADPRPSEELQAEPAFLEDAPRQDPAYVVTYEPRSRKGRRLYLRQVLRPRRGPNAGRDVPQYTTHGKLAMRCQRPTAEALSVRFAYADKKHYQADVQPAAETPGVA